MAEFLSGSESALLVLDSNHTHDHVLAELEVLAPLLPVGSYVLVADTLIEEFPEGHYENRPWDRGNNPMTAVRAFLAGNEGFELDLGWSRRALMSEFRDGIMRRSCPERHGRESLHAGTSCSVRCHSCRVRPTRAWAWV